MALTRSWQSAINDKVTGPMVLNILKRQKFIEKLMEKKGWIGLGETITTPAGPRNSYVIEFLGSTVGATKVGGYQTTANVQIADPIRGLVDSYVDFTGTFKLRSSDLKAHKGKSLADTLLGKIENQSEYLMNNFKNQIEDMIVNGGVISGVESIADVASGMLTVSRPEKFEIGMAVQFQAADATTKGTEFWVIAVNKNTKKVTFSAAIGSTAADLTNYVASTAALTFVCVNGTVSASTGLPSGSLASLKSILLTSTNGGSSTYLNKTKTSYPFLQAAEVDGSSWNASNFLPKLFAAYSTDIQMRTKHPKGDKPKDLFVSPLNYAIALINLEEYKGQYYRVDDKNANPYGWDSIMIGNSSSGTGLRLNRLESMPNDFIPVLNLDTFALVTNNGIEFESDQNGKGNNPFWFPEFAATGYTWRSDFVMSGEFVCGNPESNGAIYGLAMSLD